MRWRINPAMKLKRLLLNVAEYITCFIIFYLCVIPIHEFGHLQVLTWLKGEEEQEALDRLGRS